MGGGLDIRIRISGRSFVVMQLLLVTVTLAVCSVVSSLATMSGHKGLLGFGRLFDVGSEFSIATFISTLNLLLAAILLYLLYRSRRDVGSEDYRCWQLLSLLFFGLAMDESISIHENFSRVYQFLVQRGWFPPIMDSHEWLPFGVLFVIVAAAVFLPQLRKVNLQTAKLMVLAGAVFVTGAVGFEYLGAMMLKTEFVASKSEPIYVARRLFEEGFEMYGIALFNWAIYREMLRAPAEVVIRGLDAYVPPWTADKAQAPGLAIDDLLMTPGRPRRTPSP